MPRKPRIHFSGAIYHAMARGVERRPIFIDDHDRRIFLDQMRRYERELGAKIIAYCLMGNHFHLAIKVAAATLGAFMQRLTGGYAGGLNHRHDRVGHLFESRYKDKLCLDDRYLQALVHYIHMNPVRAGLVAAPGDWPWSSFKPTDGPFPDLDSFEPWDREEPVIDMIRTPCDILPVDAIGESTANRRGNRAAEVPISGQGRRFGAAGIRVSDASQRPYSRRCRPMARNDKKHRRPLCARINNATTGGQTLGIRSALRAPSTGAGSRSAGSRRRRRMSSR